MADLRLTRPATRPTDPADGRIGGVPWLPILLIWTGARAVTTVWMLVLVTTNGPGSRSGAGLDLVSFASLWDGRWYWYIASVGYPTTLPIDPDGFVAANQWAFMPLYPLLVAGLSLLTGLAWPAMAVLVSLVFGYLACVQLHRLLLPHLDRGRALFAVVVFAVAPASFILQVAYAEAMGVFLLLTALVLLERRRYLLMLGVVAVLAFTRPMALAVSLALVIHFVVRLRSAQRGGPAFPAGERVRAGIAAAGSGLAGLGWAATAWIATGSVTAYTDTELAWRASWIGHGPLIPFTGWFQAAPFWLPGAVGPIAVVLLVLLAVAGLFLPPVRRLGTDIRIWCAAYLVYLFAILFPQSSTIRLLMPLAPAVGAFAVSRAPGVRLLVVFAALGMQLLWLTVTWGPVESWWTIP